MFELLLSKVLPNLTGNLKGQLLKQLKSAGKKILADELAKQIARAYLKGIDAFVAISVANLPREDADKLSGAYAAALLEQFNQLAEAISIYVPMQVEVEMAKKQFGANSNEANAARKKRETGIKEMRAEVRDVMQAVTGGAVSD